MKLLILLLATWNIITFIIMGLDKYKAVHDKSRISEKALLLNALVMGAVGEIIGAFVFHHKTKKLKFQVFLPIALILNGLVVYGLIYFGIV